MKQCHPSRVQNAIGISIGITVHHNDDAAIDSQKPNSALQRFDVFLWTAVFMWMRQTLCAVKNETTSHMLCRKYQFIIAFNA